MLNYKRCLKILITITFLSFYGCTAPKIYNKASYIKTNTAIYPAISLVVNDGYYNDMRSLDMYKGVIDSFRKSGLFSRVDINNAYVPYGFDIKFKELTKANTKNTTAFLVGAASLFIVPMPIKRKFSMDVTIRLKDKIIKKYHYEIKGTEKIFLLYDPVKATYEAADTLTSYLFRDLEKDKILPHI